MKKGFRKFLLEKKLGFTEHQLGETLLNVIEEYANQSKPTDEKIEKLAEDFADDLYKEYIGKGTLEGDNAMIEKRRSCVNDFIEGFKTALNYKPTSEWVIESELVKFIQWQTKNRETIEVCYKDERQAKIYLNDK